MFPLKMGIFYSYVSLPEGNIVYWWFICQSHPSFFPTISTQECLRHFRLDGLVWWGHSFPKLPANSSASEFKTIHQPKMSPSQTAGSHWCHWCHWCSALNWDLLTRSFLYVAAKCDQYLFHVAWSFVTFLHPLALSMWSTYSERIFSTSPSH